MSFLKINSKNVINNIDFKITKIENQDEKSVVYFSIDKEDSSNDNIRYVEIFLDQKRKKTTRVKTKYSLDLKKRQSKKIFNSTAIDTDSEIKRNQYFKKIKNIKENQEKLIFDLDKDVFFTENNQKEISQINFYSSFKDTIGIVDNTIKKYLSKEEISEIKSNTPLLLKKIKEDTSITESDFYKKSLSLKRSYTEILKSYIPSFEEDSDNNQDQDSSYIDQGESFEY